MRGHNLIENLEVDNGTPHKVDVIVNWSYTPGRMYSYNGDPGTPEEQEWEFDIIHAYRIEDDGSETELSSDEFDELWHYTQLELCKLEWDELIGR